MDESVPEIGIEKIDAILGYLPRFEQRCFKFGEWRAPEGQLPFFSFSDGAAGFICALYRQGMIIPFDWRSWEEDATQYQLNCDALAAADLSTIQRLLTLHVRKDRLAEGHLAKVFEQGQLTTILRRLEQIRDDLAGDA